MDNRVAIIVSLAAIFVLVTPSLALAKEEPRPTCTACSGCNEAPSPPLDAELDAVSREDLQRIWTSP